MGSELCIREVVKHALIGDERLFDLLVESWPLFASRDVATVQEILQRACQVKIDIVGRDEREHGPRAFLNFGHTFGHALEQATEVKVLTHLSLIPIIRCP